MLAVLSRHGQGDSFVRHPNGSRWQQPVWLLAAVALVHGLAPLVLLGAHWGYGVDETIYLSQINAHVPAGLFSAPRARGATLIAAPVTALTSSVPAVRIWLAGLSTVGLFLAYRPWLGLRHGYVVPTAALLFSSLWPVSFYGFEAMPNEWVAFAVVAAAGYTAQFLRDGRYRQVAWVVAAMTVAALFRPSDAGFAAVGLAVVCLFARAAPRLRLAAAVAVVAGTVLGTVEWVVEAYTSFGGLGARIHEAQAEQGGGGLRFSGLAQARSLAGPLLCRAGCHAHATVMFWLWWPVGAGLTLLAVWFGRHQLRRSPELTVLPVAIASAAQYVLTVDYAAPRFLIPTYALLALPCASAVVALRARVGRGRPRVILTAGLVAMLVAHAAIQVDVVVVHVRPPLASFARQVRADAAALHALGVQPPCVVLGQPSWNEALAYATRCRNVPTSATAVRRLRGKGTKVVWLGPSKPPTRYGPGWRPVHLPGPNATDNQVAYLAVSHER